MGVKLYEKPENQSPGPLIAIVIIIMLLLLTSKCHAQQKAAIDTMVCTETELSLHLALG